MPVDGKIVAKIDTKMKPLGIKVVAWIKRRRDLWVP